VNQATQYAQDWNKTTGWCRMRRRGHSAAAGDSPGRVRQAEPVGDALEDSQRLNLGDAPHDVADLALGHAAGDRDLRLRPRVLAQQREQPADVTIAKRRRCLEPEP
jgi:hypothetical protein